MATHSNILVWRIPLTEEPGGPQSIVSQSIGHDWAPICVPEQRAVAALWTLDLGEAKGRTKSEKCWVLRNMPPRFLSLALLNDLKIPCSRPQTRDLEMQVTRLGISICKDSGWTECQHPWQELRSETAVYWWCPKSAMGTAALPQGACSFVNTCDGAWKITHGFLTTSQIPHLPSK